MTKFFKKSQKTYFCGIFGTFLPNLGKIEFPWKEGLSVFKYANYLESCKKSEETNEPFPKKMPN